ncbi:hypothetical protein [Mangrovibacter plantisponsor]|uniref:hypothetical protein n=1 Tax=Mangrovibacter plantisponsor TaxID=451513 RepID=UPI000D7091C0|nr:hypothetical protein [Mangrovibacter plantisponsor]
MFIPDEAGRLHVIQSVCWLKQFFTESGFICDDDHIKEFAIQRYRTAVDINQKQRFMLSHYYIQFVRQISLYNYR